MVNIDKHISHWQSGAEEDFEVADQLIRSGKIRPGKRRICCCKKPEGYSDG